MPPEETEIDWKGWIVDIAVNYAVPLAGEYLSGLIRQHFSQNQNNMEVMFKNAVEEVCSRVKETIDQAFLNQYLSDCRHVSNQIRIYGDTHDRDVLTNAQIESSRLTSRLYDMGFKAAGGFYMASNMHLASLRALSEIDGSYKNTLRDFTQDYIEKGMNLNSQINGRATQYTPNECEWIEMRYPLGIRAQTSSDNGYIRALTTRYTALTGEVVIPDYVNVGGYILKYSDGRDRPYQRAAEILSIDNENKERMLQACSGTRQSLIDEDVQPILTITNRTENVIANWRNWSFQ